MHAVKRKPIYLAHIRAIDGGFEFLFRSANGDSSSDDQVIDHVTVCIDGVSSPAL